MQIGELFFKLGIQGGENAAAAVQKLKTGVSGLVTPMNVARLEILGVTAALVAFVASAAKSAQELVRFTNVTGLSAQELQRWQQAAAGSGVSGDELASSIKAIQRAQTNLQLGRGDYAPWALLGLNPNQDPFAVLAQLQERIKSVPTARGTMFAEELGLSENVVSFIREMKTIPAGDKSLLLSDAEIKRLKAFDVDFNRLMDNAKRLTQKFGMALIPVAEKVLHFFDHIRMGFTDVGRLVQQAEMHMHGFGRTILMVGALIAAAFFPVTAAVLGIFLLIEDFAVHRRGGKSVIGALIKYFSVDGATMDLLKKGWDGVVSLAEKGMEKIDKAMENLGAWSAKSLIAYFSDWDRVLDDIVNKLTTINGVMHAITSWIPDPGKNIMRDVNDLVGIGRDIISGDSRRGLSMLQHQPTPLQNAVTNQVQVDIQVDGSKSPHETAGMIEQLFTEKMAAALYQMPRPEY